MGEKDKLFTTQESAQQLSLSDSHLRKLIMLGRAHPTRQIGGTWMFTLEEIERLRNRPRGKPGRKTKSS